MSSDSDSGSDSDGLGSLLKKSNKNTDRVCKPTRSRMSKRTSKQSASDDGDANDDLNLIAPIDSNRHQLIVKNRLLKQSLDQKSQHLKQHEQLIAQLTKDLSTELNDNGSNLSVSYQKIITKLLHQSKDILSYNRNFYFFNMIPESINDGIDLKISSVVGDQYPSNQMVFDGFKYSNRTYLRKLNQILHRNLMMEPSHEPIPALSITVEPHDLGIISSQLDNNDELLVKLDHYNPSPDLNILRLELLVNVWAIGRLNPTNSQIVYHDTDLKSNQAVFDQLLIKTIMLSVCDTNALKTCYKDVLRLIELTLVMLDRCGNHQLLAQYLQLDLLYKVKIYGQLQPSNILNYHYGLHYNMLNILNVTKQTLILKGFNKDLNLSKIIKEITCQWLEEFKYEQTSASGIINDHDIKVDEYFQSVYDLTQVDLTHIFTDINHINKFFRIHYGLRLLNYVIRPEVITTRDYQILVESLGSLKNRYHQLMGEISFSNVSDPFNIKFSIIQVLNDDYNYLNYFQVKVGKYLSSGGKDFFYE